MFSLPESWERQYFKKYPTSNTDFLIPLSDGAAYSLYPNHNWVYNKIELCKKQNIEAYPHDVTPQHFPIFSKPVCNLFGMSIGATVLSEEILNEEGSWSPKFYKPGHFWMPILHGDQYSVDVVIENGSIKWMYSMKAFKDDIGSFIYFRSEPLPVNVISSLAKWISTHFKEYTGVLNVEFIGDKIIECHLRMSTQFVDLYGDGWLDNVVTLYRTGSWEKIISPPNGVSYVIRTPKFDKFIISEKLIQQLAEQVSSIQLTIDPSLENNINDDNTYRLAIVNGFSMKDVKTVVDLLTWQFNI